MTADFDTADHELGAIVCLRLSQLLREERKAKSLSIRTLARKLKIKRKRIKKWEAGKGCPPGPVMIAIFKHYGRDSFHRLVDLDFNLQMLKYQRALARRAVATDALKVPAVMSAVGAQSTLAA